METKILIQCKIYIVIFSSIFLQTCQESMLRKTRWTPSIRFRNFPIQENYLTHSISLYPTCIFYFFFRIPLIKLDSFVFYWNIFGGLAFSTSCCLVSFSTSALKIIFLCLTQPLFVFLGVFFYFLLIKTPPFLYLCCIDSKVFTFVGLCFLNKVIIIFSCVSVNIFWERNSFFLPLLWFFACVIYVKLWGLGKVACFLFFCVIVFLGWECFSWKLGRSLV